MDEQASFETRAVLAPRRTRMARLALVLPAIALVAIAWAGLSGDRSDSSAAVSPDPAVVAAPSRPVEAAYPARVVGLDVRRLDDIQPDGLGRDDVVAVAGWYVASTITDCPPLAILYRDASLPEVRHDADSWAYCDRSGMLYASRPGLDQRPPPKALADDRSGNAGLPEVAVTLVIGVIVPPELEAIGAGATEVVVVGRFVEPGEGCGDPAGCSRELVVDHVAWTPGA